MNITTGKISPEASLSVNEKQEIRFKLDQFYQSVPDYLAFQEISDQSLCWELIVSTIDSKNARDQSIRILEVGAGCSGFSLFLKNKSIRHLIHYTAQDVTDQNVDWLSTQADEIVLGDVTTIAADQRFDIIFSTYVFEHVTNPSTHLSTIVKLLKSGGSLFIFCPRYDIPGYLCPSSRHLGLFKQIEFGLRSTWARINSLVQKQPSFLIQTDLAAFYGPFFKDSDAVHWVSLLDILLWGKKHQLFTRSIRLVSWNETGFKNWIVKRWLTCAVQLQKRDKAYDA